VKLAPYPSYKPSGVDWLGEVPEHWEVVPIYARYHVDLGKMLNEARISGDHLVRYLRNVDVQWDRIEHDDLPEMDIAPHELERFTVKRGDLLVCEGGEVGRAAIVSETTEGLGYQKALHRLRPMCARDVPRFMFYILRWASSQGVFFAGGNPNTIPHLTGEKLRRYRFPSPSYVEQRAIADFLDRETAKIDTLVARKRTLIERLKEKRTALISRTVTRGLPPDAAAQAGLDPHPNLKPSGIDWLGEVPEHWEVIPLKWRARCKSGDGISTDEVAISSDNEMAVPVIGGNGVMGFTNQTNVLEPVLAIGRVGALCGNVHQVSTPAWVTDNALVLRSDDRSYERRYLAAVLRSRNLNEIADKTAQPLITGTQVRDQRLPRPPLTEQIILAEFIAHETAKIDAMTTKVEAVIERLQEYRTALITAAVTGKIDVRGAAV
jgi:type I restriction enzyme S subunit